MALNLANADAVLKEDYLPAIREQLNSSTYYLSKVVKNEEDIVGRRAIIAVNKSRNRGIGARADGGTLPAAGQQGYADLLIPVKYNYARIKVTGPTIKAMTKDEGSFTRAVDSELKGALRDLKNDYNRQLIFGDGTGALAKCGTTSASTTVQLNTTETDTMKYMEVGMYIDIIDVDDDTVLASNRSITALNTTNDTITISGAAVTTDSTHRICLTGSWKNEVNGFSLIVSTTGTFQGINRATAGNEWWKGNVYGNSGTLRAISDDLLQQVWDDCEEKGDAEDLILITTRGIRRKYINTLTAQKRFVNNLDLGGGFKAVDFNNSPMLVDKDAPAHKVRYVNVKNVQIYRMSDWSWMNEDGAVLSRVSGEDAYEAVLYNYSEQGADRCNAHGTLDDITQ